MADVTNFAVRMRLIVALKIQICTYCDCVYFTLAFIRATKQIMNKFLSFQNNQGLLLNFGAQSLNLFLDSSQHVRFLK
jgi:hypothetical protein